MPIYEYACTRCEHAFDELQKVSEPALVHCPRCGEASLRKLLSAPKFRLKGEGWYETDFKTGNKRNIAGDGEGASSAASDDGAAKKADDKAGKKTDEKAAKKTDTKPATGSKASSA